MLSSNTLLWKFKGSTGPFNQLPSVTLPCKVSLVRENLKVSLGLSESTFIDFVIYLESDPDVVLSDNFILLPNARVYTRRCTSDEANSLISQANSVFKPKPELEELLEVHNETSVDYVFDVPKDLIQDQEMKADEDDEELSRIRGIIEQQRTHESARIQQIQKTYYTNVNNLSTQRPKAQPTDVSPPTSTVPLPSTYDPMDSAFLGHDYICHMCGQRGHNIKDCTNNDGKRLSKKIRPSTGIPTDFLTSIPFEDVPKYEEVYILKDGTFAIMREIESVSGGAFFTKTVDQRIQTQLGISEKDSQALSKGFKCTICLCYFNNPVTTLCCGETFCLDCIIGKKNVTFTNNIVCPTCRKTIKTTDLQSNTSLKKAVQSLILGNVDVLKNVNKEKEKEEVKKEPEKIQKSFGLKVESLKRQREMVEKYLEKYRTYKDIL